MSKLDDMAYMRGRDDARCGLPRFPRRQHPDQYGAYNAGYRDWGKLQEAPAMVEALRYVLPVLRTCIGQRINQSEIDDIAAILARIDGEGGK